MKEVKLDNQKKNKKKTATQISPINCLGVVVSSSYVSIVLCAGAGCCLGLLGGRTGMGSKIFINIL